jgi:hypothetical protein
MPSSHCECYVLLHRDSPLVVQPQVKRVYRQYEDAANTRQESIPCLDSTRS